MSGANIELERRFLIRSDEWLGSGRTESISQGYLSTDRERIVRVRTAGERAWLTVKGESGAAGSRVEIECDIPFATARAILAQPRLCIGTIIEKTRTRVRTATLEWDVDVFGARNSGLRMAEVEYDGTMTEEDWHARVEAERPTWTGDEITGLHEFANSALTERPFDTWPEEMRAAIAAGVLPR